MGVIRIKELSEIEQRAKNEELAKKDLLFTPDLICELVAKGTGKKCGDMWQASHIVWDVLFQGHEARAKLFRAFLNVSTNVDYDWFSRAFNNTAANKEKKHQDFTPGNLGQILDKLIDVDNDGESDSGTRYDVGAGTGSLTIQKWNGDRRKHSPFTYRPSMYWYEAEELKLEGEPSYALPFLLFNFLIRGMDGVVIAGNSLTREVSQVFFIQNVPDDHLKFSSLNVMPRTPEIEQDFDVRSWIDEPIDYMEDKLGLTENKDGVKEMLVFNDMTVKEEERKRQEAEHEKDMLDSMLNIVKQHNEDNPKSKKIKDTPKDKKNKLGNQLDDMLRIFGVEPDPDVRKQYFGD